MDSESSIDLQRLFLILWKKLYIIVIVTILTALVGWGYSSFVITPKYTSSFMMYVENKDSNDNNNLNVNDITAAQKIVNTCQIIFKSETVMDKLKESADLEYTTTELNNMITVAGVNSTEVIKITVEANSPAEAKNIAKEFASIATTEFHRVIKSGSIQSVTVPKENPIQSSPNVMKNTLIAFILGFVASCGIIVLFELFDTTVKQGDDLLAIYNVPVFAEITSNDANNKTYKSKGSYYYEYKTKN